MLLNNEFQNYVFEYFDGKTVLESDDLTVVIRGHLLVENILEKLLSKKMDIKVFEDDKEFTFNIKMKMAYSMGLLNDLYPSIKRLNKIRNDFAHEIETRIQDMDIAVFIELFEHSGDTSDPAWKAALGNKKVCFGIVIHYILRELSGIYKRTPVGDQNFKKEVLK